MSYLFLSCTELKMNIFIRDEREEDIKEIEELT
ncbi:GNAT family N-acetyltransferase, partial [Acinetobacter baumannii]|nr:GNAT family N-acetyltransferase [Acinetobacter baumannii]